MPFPNVLLLHYRIMEQTTTNRSIIPYIIHFIVIMHIKFKHYVIIILFAINNVLSFAQKKVLSFSLILIVTTVFSFCFISHTNTSKMLLCMLNNVFFYLRLNSYVHNTSNEILYKLIFSLNLYKSEKTLNVRVYNYVPFLVTFMYFPHVFNYCFLAYFSHYLLCSISTHHAIGQFINFIVFTAFMTDIYIIITCIKCFLTKHTNNNIYCNYNNTQISLFSLQYAHRSINFHLDENYVSYSNNQNTQTIIFYKRNTDLHHNRHIFFFLLLSTFCKGTKGLSLYIKIN